MILEKYKYLFNSNYIYIIIYAYYIFLFSLYIFALIVYLQNVICLRVQWEHLLKYEVTSWLCQWKTVQSDIVFTLIGQNKRH